jgi:hypothetical protein
MLSSPSELADIIVATLEGALMISRLRQSEAPLHTVRKYLLVTLETLRQRGRPRRPIAAISHP